MSTLNIPQIVALVIVVLGATAATVCAVLYALRDVDASDMGGDK